MNPKGLLIVSFIAPASTFATLPGYVGFMATLALVVIPVGSAWIVLGSRFEGIQKAWLTPLKINRATSIVIGCFATLMVGRVAGSTRQHKNKASSCQLGAPFISKHHTAVTRFSKLGFAILEKTLESHFSHNVPTVFNKSAKSRSCRSPGCFKAW